MAFNAAGASGVQSTYGQGNGLGTIYQYGHQTPLGPYTGLPVAKPGGGTTGTASSSGSSGPTAAAQTFLNGVLSGDKLPYSPDRINQMYSQASDMNASAEGALNDRMDMTAAAGGASANDPSRQGAKLNTMAKRQTANSTAKRDINQTATGANFDSQMRAAGMLEESRRQSEALQAGMQRTAMGYMPWSQGGGGQSQSTPGSYVGGYGGNAYTNQTDGRGNGEQSQTGYNQWRDDYRKTDQWEADRASAMAALNKPKKPYPVASDGYYELE
jgi:hypothetical protein